MSEFQEHPERWLVDRTPPGVSQERFLRDRQFFAIIREETYERPMHELSRELHTGIVPDERIMHLLDSLWRDKP
jgi:hypothetical protein